MFACSLIKQRPEYPWEEVNTGLSNAGFTLEDKDLDRCNLLVTWTPWASSLAAKAGKQFSRSWMVFENGYVPEINGERYYSCGINGYNGNGRPLSKHFGRLLPIELEEPKPGGDYILVVGQFGIKDSAYTMPPEWPDSIMERIRAQTNMPVVFRPKSSRPNKKPKRQWIDMVVDYETSLEDQIRGAHCIVIWNSPSTSIKTLLTGKPLYIDAPRAFAKPWSTSSFVRPILANRDNLIEKLSREQFSTNEIAHGIPFELIKCE